MTRYLFDTNVFRDIVDHQDGRNGIDVAQAEKVRACLNGRGDKIVVAIESLHELLAHVRKEEADRYPYYHKVICTVLEYTNEHVLEYAGDVVDRVILQLPEQPLRQQGILDACRVLRQLTDFEELCTNKVKAKSKSPTGEVYSFLAYLDMVREKELYAWNDEWADRMIRVAEQTFWPDYRYKLSSGMKVAISDDVTRKKALDTLYSPETAMVMMAGIADRAGVEWPITEETFEPLSQGLCAFYCAFKSMWRNCIENGYSFTKQRNMNDYVDFQLLMHLIDDGITLVSNDKRLLDRLPSDCSQHHRVMSFRELCTVAGV